jgi:hypothetical protein
MDEGSVKTWYRGRFMLVIDRADYHARFGQSDGYEQERNRRRSISLQFRRNLKTVFSIAAFQMTTSCALLPKHTIPPLDAKAIDRLDVTFTLEGRLGRPRYSILTRGHDDRAIRAIVNLYNSTRDGYHITGGSATEIELDFELRTSSSDFSWGVSPNLEEYDSRTIGYYDRCDRPEGLDGCKNGATFQKICNALGSIAIDYCRHVVDPISR